MPLVGSRLHGYVHDAAAGLPELRGIVAGLNGILLNRIRAGLVLLNEALT